MTLQVPVCSLSIRKCVKISVFGVKIAKFFSGLRAQPPIFYQNLGEPLITIAIFHFLQKQRGVLQAENTANCDPSNNFSIVLTYSGGFAAQLIISVCNAPY